MNFNLKLELKNMDKNGADPMKEGSGESPSKSPDDGEYGAYDVMELQARAILMLASHEAEQRMCKEQDKCAGARPPRMMAASEIQRRLCGGQTTGLSMKASLQRFLQKRNLRAQARCPY
uniref:Uncharacterized protein n=1 Tax=Kalanchoe fedtschenkoi TaxID=63787 RepID=A0A7N0VIY0_KALFE